MDWLSEHYAQLDCRAKTISVGKHGEVRVTWKGEKTTDEKFLLSATEARRYVKKGATCFLAYLINKPKDQPKIEEVRVVKEKSSLVLTSYREPHLSLSHLIGWHLLNCKSLRLNCKT